MTTPHGHPDLSAPRRSLLAAALAGIGAAAQAQLPPPTPPAAPTSATEPQTWSIGVLQTFTQESNLFRLSDGDDSQGDRDDLVSTTGLNFRLDQPLGRQRLRGQADFQHNRYREHDELDSTGHDLRLMLDWETINNLSGNVGAQSVKRQYRYGLDSTSAFDGRNDETTQTAFFKGRLGGLGLWSLQFGADTLRRDYSAEQFATEELSQSSGEFGVGYRPSPDLGGALVARHTRIDRPDVTRDGAPPLEIVGDDVTRNDIELTAVWQASGASRLEGRATRSQEDHKTLDDRSFWTGSLAWHWAPSAKLNFTTRIGRDTEGQSGNVLTAGAQAPTVPAGDQLRDAFEWTAQWEATAKILVLGTAQWSKRKLGRIGEGPELNDRTQALSLGLRYNAARWLDLGCDVRHEDRKTNAGTADERVVTRPYDAMAVGCTLALWFR